MCGKFTQFAGWDRLVAYAEDILRNAATTDTVIETITPMRVANVIRLNAGAGCRDGDIAGSE